MRVRLRRRLAAAAGARHRYDGLHASFNPRGRAGLHDEPKRRAGGRESQRSRHVRVRRARSRGRLDPVDVQPAQAVQLVFSEREPRAIEVDAAGRHVHLPRRPCVLGREPAVAHARHVRRRSVKSNQRAHLQLRRQQPAHVLRTKWVWQRGVLSDYHRLDTRS